MITCQIMGGLGNQLFQIFATISHAINTNSKFIFLNSIAYGKRNSYWYTFLYGLKFSLVQQLPNKMKWLREKGFHYQSIPACNSNNDYLLCGYYQSEKYFKDNYDTIYKLLKLHIFKEEIQNKYDYNYNQLISMHFRVGDYVKIQDCHPIMKYEYYHNCISYLIEKLQNDALQILYFCEEESNVAVGNIIYMLKQSFPNCNFIKASDELKDWEQMLMMSYCAHHIIANSSFSWWGAYFNPSKEKIVCYPEKWFGPKLSMNNTIDLCPEEWNKIICN